MEEDNQDKVDEVGSEHSKSDGAGTEEDNQDEVKEVRSDRGESGAAICLPLRDRNGTVQCRSLEDICKYTRMIQSTVNSIPENGNDMLKELGIAAVECIQLVSDLWSLNVGWEALQRATSNAGKRALAFLKFLNKQCMEDKTHVFNPNNWPAILNGVPPRHRDDDTIVMRPNTNPPPIPLSPNSPPPTNPPPNAPSPSAPPNVLPTNSPPPTNPPPNAPPPSAPPNPPSPSAPPNMPPTNSTLDTIMTATMQMLHYVWANKWWIITGAAVGGVVAAGGAGVGGVAVVGVGGGAVAGLAAKKIKDWRTQDPPHEHRD